MIIFIFVTYLLICENNTILTLKRCKVGRAASTSLVEAVDTGQCYHVDFGWFAQYRRDDSHNSMDVSRAHVRESYFARIICKPENRTPSYMHRWTATANFKLWPRASMSSIYYLPGILSVQPTTTQNVRFWMHLCSC